MRIDKDLKALVIAEAKRVIQILEEDTNEYRYDSATEGELKGKMKELRRDTIRIEKQLRGY